MRENLSVVDRTRRSAATVFGAARYAPGGRFGPRLQPDVQLVAVQAGEARIEVDGCAFRVGPGEAVLLFPGGRESFAFARNAETRHTWCAVAAGAAASAGLMDDPEPGRVRPMPDRAARLIDLGLNWPAGPEAGLADAALDDLGRAALAAFRLAAGGGRAEAAVPPALLTARAYLEAHYGRPLTVRELADAAHVSAPHLIRQWRRWWGGTPAEALWEYRTARGIELLRETGLGVAEIADRTGFRSPFHFARRVREATGTSPRALRRAAWGLDAPA